jgi:hypothetical protein
MYQTELSSDQKVLFEVQSRLDSLHQHDRFGRSHDPALAAFMTMTASTQTYYTIRLLADRERAADAYRAYAYFRWVDDVLDQGQITRAERLAFLSRQQAIIACCYQRKWPYGLQPEEQLVVDLIHHNQTKNNGLRTYIKQMMAVMAFDAKRKGRLISQDELTTYTRSLATAVTEALHYFIGYDDNSPQDDSRYDAVTGAHITHMLRDAMEDAAVGYINIPGEYLEAHSIGPNEFNQAAYRAWVYDQVQLARGYFASGRSYLARVENSRCRLAGYAYIARFEVVLDAIEADGYRLRRAYPERKSHKVRLRMFMAALRQTLTSSVSNRSGLVPDCRPSTEIIW